MKTIYLIAGHHNNDPGAVGEHYKLNKITEAAFTMEQRDLIYDELKAHNNIGKDFNVVLDNDKDDLRTVIKKLNDVVKPNDIVVDLHFNAFNTKATGTEVIIPSINSRLERELAKDITDILSDVMQIPNRGVKTEASLGRRIGILHGKGNRILIETMFIDNPSDVTSYVKNKFIIAQEIAILLEKAIKQ